MKLITVNMAQMRRWATVDSDNIRAYDSIYKTKGKVLTLTPEVYTEHLLAFGIFYTVVDYK